MVSFGTLCWATELKICVRIDLGEIYQNLGSKRPNSKVSNFFLKNSKNNEIILKDFKPTCITALINSGQRNAKHSPFKLKDSLCCNTKKNSKLAALPWSIQGRGVRSTLLLKLNVLDWLLHAKNTTRQMPFTFCYEFDISFWRRLIINSMKYFIHNNHIPNRLNFHEFNIKGECFAPLCPNA